MSPVIEVTLSLLIVIGAFLVLIGSFGLIKLPDFYTRLHAPTKATTLGMGCLLLASLGLSTVDKGYLSVQELLITIFLFITAPIAAHMLAKAALHLEMPSHSKTKNSELQEPAKHRRAPNSDVPSL